MSAIPLDDKTTIPDILKVCRELMKQKGLISDKVKDLQFQLRKARYACVFILIYTGITTTPMPTMEEVQTTSDIRSGPSHNLRVMSWARGPETIKNRKSRHPRESEL